MAEAGKPAEISAQAEEYLEAMCRIRDRGDMATPTEIARELEIAPPSALGMIRRMTEQGLVDYSRREGATLTARGEAAADTLRRRHRLAERLLTDLLRMPWARAHEVACRFEHVIDDELEPYLLAALHHPTTCPHGNPLDTRASAELRPLSTMAVGQTVTLRRILDESAPLLDYLNAHHLCPGARVTVCALAPFDGPLTVAVEGERIALGRNLAQHLLVEEVVS